MNNQNARILAILLLAFSSCQNATLHGHHDDQEKPALMNIVPSEYHTHALKRGVVDKNGGLWFTTNYAGLFHFDGRGFRQYTMEDGLHADRLSPLVFDGKEHLWIGTDKGLSMFDGERFTKVDIPWDGNQNLWGKDMNANHVISLLSDSKGWIWLGTWGGGVHRFDPSKMKNGKYEFTSFLQDQGSQYENNTYRNVIQSIKEDEKGNIWLTSMSHGGVTKYDGQTFTNYTLVDGLIDDMVFSCLPDRKGNVWFGMLGNREGGLDKFDGQIFHHYNVGDGLCSNNITNIFEDSRGMFWLSSSRGELCTFHPDSLDAEGNLKFVPFDGNGTGPFKNIQFIVEDKEHNIWFGGNYGQLYRWDGNDIVKY